MPSKSRPPNPHSSEGMYPPGDCRNKLLRGWNSRVLSKHIKNMIGKEPTDVVVIRLLNMLYRQSDKHCRGVIVSNLKAIFGYCNLVFCSRKAVPGSAFCGKCKVQHQEALIKTRYKRRSENCCVDCGHPLPNDIVMLGERVCHTCRVARPTYPSAQWLYRKEREGVKE